MKTIRIFLASSNELKADREQFEIEIGRKNKLWRDKGIVLHLDIWEDSNARMSLTRSQDEYNKLIENDDVFVLLAHTKVGIYTDEEFETAFGTFQKTEKPFIFTYFKNPKITPDESLDKFKDKLNDLGHFYSSYEDFNDLWNQFNKELDRLLHADFMENDISKSEFYVNNSKADIKSQFINSTFNNPVFNYNGTKIPKHLGSIPVRPDVFIGRDNNTQEIHQHFQGGKDKNLLLLVNGEGGIGKTTMASKYYHEFTAHYQHLIWLVSEKGIKEAIISLALPLQIKFQPNFTQEQQVDEVLRHVLELKTPTLLIIDNANDLEDLKVSKDTLQKFQHVDILITSRVDNYTEIESYKVNHLHPEAADKLFKQYYKAFQDEEQKLLDELLKAIGYNTLVIELLAKNLHEFNTGLESHYPLQKLLEDIQDKGVLQIQKSTEIHTLYMEAATPEAIINSMYDISPLSEEEQQILSIFGVLPTTVLPYQDLKQFLPKIDMLDRVLIGLSKKGWIDYDEDAQSFKTNPIISEIARVQNKERLREDTLSLLQFLGNILGYQQGIGLIEGDFEEIKKNVSYAETIIYNFWFSSYNTCVVLERLANFYRTYGNLDKALVFGKEFLKLSNELYENEPTNLNLLYLLGISYEKQGDTYTALGKFDRALYFFSSYNKLFKELFQNYPTETSFKHNLAISCYKIGSIYILLGDLNKALTIFENFSTLTKELAENNPDSEIFRHTLAISYEKLGDTHLELGNLENALLFFEEKLLVAKKLYNYAPNKADLKNSLAISYEKLGETHEKLGNFDKALIFFKDSFSLTEELFETYTTHLEFKNGLAVSYAKIGSLYVDRLNDKEAGINYLLKAFTFYKELTEKHPNYADFQSNYDWVVAKLKSLE